MALSNADLTDIGLGPGVTELLGAVRIDAGRAVHVIENALLAVVENEFAVTIG
jgi:hypothetical protein